MPADGGDDPPGGGSRRERKYGMKLKKELIKREIAGDVVLVPVGRTVYEANGLFILNEVGAFLWDKLSQAENADALLDAVLAEYEVDENTAKADVAAFLERLRQMEIID